MELREKLSIGMSDGDQVEDKLLDVLKAVQLKIDDVKGQCDEVDADNMDLASQIQKELEKQAKLKEKITF